MTVQSIENIIKSRQTKTENNKVDWDQYKINISNQYISNFGCQRMFKCVYHMVDNAVEFDARCVTIANPSPK